MDGHSVIAYRVSRIPRPHAQPHFDSVVMAKLSEAQLMTRFGQHVTYGYTAISTSMIG
jgi:hypothetical protein